MYDKKLKAAVVGAGGWGYQHARALFEREDVILGGIYGRTEERTKKRAEQFRTNAYTDLDRMIETEQPGLICVCLPAQHTFETTMKLIETGIPLLVEKPLAYDLHEAEELIRAAEAKDLFFAIDFEQRYSIPCQMAKQAILDGRLGTPVFANWRFGHGWGSEIIDHPFTNLIEAQCHGFNTLEFFFGPIRSVMAEMTQNGGKQSFATFSLALSFENGAVGTFFATLDANEHNRLCQLIELGGTDARILIEDNVQRYTFQPTFSDTAETWSAGFFDDAGRAFSKSLDRYLDDMIPVLRRGGQPPVPAAEGLRARRIAEACIRSFETGTRVSVD